MRRRRKTDGAARPSKYRNRVHEYKGIRFPSNREMLRFIILEQREANGEITDLNRQVRFQLLPSQRDENGKVIERPCFYVADFTYRDKDGKFHVEDSKGFRPPSYILKRKMLLWFHGIRIEEV